jgi:hypothetical protein
VSTQACGRATLENGPICKGPAREAKRHQGDLAFLRNKLKPERSYLTLDITGVEKKQTNVNGGPLIRAITTLHNESVRRRPRLTPGR